ncbi:hypothetical protein JCGZ_07110 [Jatropha curcas]|uniref:DUF868 domain-containing protein n=1 Tax=Jatropha curcas TaxID=180498 RepID=A0A067KP02_JATCU|nr:uncharacterized protein LOC105637579 [Jatropha curcas]KDP33539.1 hypothetical protein JCGZ_07110 [Jatropha curcas]
MSPRSSPFPSCFRPSSNTTVPENNRTPPSPPPPPPTTSGNPNLTSCLYQTELGLFSLTWSRSFIGHSLHLQLHSGDTATASPFSFSNPSSLSILSFHVHIKPFIFWKKHGSKKLHVINQEPNASVPGVQIFWDLSRAKFGSGPEPQSGFYIAVVVDREIILLVGDLTKQACAKTRAKRADRSQVLVLRREHVYGNRVYTTKARFGGKNRDISIDCTVNNDARLCFSVDNQKVLQIKRLKWKFRGNEKIEVDGVPTQVSWDVYNWLFEDVNNGHAVFMFRFETQDIEDAGEEEEEGRGGTEVCNGQDEKNGVVPWQHSNLGMSGIEWRKMRSLMRTTRSSSSSSISMSSASSAGGSSSIMEWASTEENELSSPNGFSLLVYAWRK